MWLLPDCSTVNAAMANRYDEHGLPFALSIGTADSYRGNSSCGRETLQESEKLE